MSDPRSLRPLPLFEGCTDAELEVAGRLLTPVDASPGRVLMVQGDYARQFVVVEPGSGVKGRILSGNDQTGGAGTELPLALTLQIEDENGTPVPDQIINWVVVQGGGSMYLETTVTGPAGTTQNFWILGTPGAQVVEARAVNSTSGAAITFAVFRATAE